MPKIEEFEKNLKGTRKTKKESAMSETTENKTKKARRRPGRDETVETSEALNTADTGETVENTFASSEDPGVHAAEGASESTTSEKVQLNFPGSDIIRERAPKAFELAETIADEWVKDGRFEGLQVGHPLAQFAAQAGLRKAKDIEKKLDEKGVFQLAKVGLMYAKSLMPRK